ncbi:unnamed protein product [Lactuca saligna]|uniref:Myb/SANT-like domain-containing protein n=1 Tax=Lactuca saligna TaxID=75948 RepID=A0AA35VS52_LACSI|nr:unnamed protein product [Lactuca saligna]
MTKRVADGGVVKKENLSWTDHMDNVLFEYLVKEDQIGNRVNGTLTLQAYANMIATMNKQFNKSITKANKEVILENESKDDDEDIQIVSAMDVSPDGISKAKKLKTDAVTFAIFSAIIVDTCFLFAGMTVAFDVCPPLMLDPYFCWLSPIRFSYCLIVFPASKYTYND